MIREIREIINLVVILLALIILIAYTVDMLVGADYALKITFSQSNLTETPFIHYLPLYLFTIPLYISIPIPIALSQLALTFIVIYVILLALAISRKENILDTIRKGVLSDNDGLSFITYMGISLLLIIIVQSLQERYGVSTGELHAPNEYIRYVSALIAPLLEEIGFRLTLIGVFSILIYLIIYFRHMSIKGIIVSLWRPYDMCSEYIKSGRCINSLYILVVLSGVAFGLAHYLSGGGWEIGKISTATIAGITLGYLYVRHGFHSAVLGHAYYNVFLLSMYYIEREASGIWIILMELTYFLIMLQGMIALSSLFINRIFRENVSPKAEETPSMI